MSECRAPRRDTNDEQKRATHQTTRPAFNWTLVISFKEETADNKQPIRLLRTNLQPKCGPLAARKIQLPSLSDEQHFRGFYQLLILVFYCAAFSTKWGETENRLQRRPLHFSGPPPPHFSPSFTGPSSSFDYSPLSLLVPFPSKNQTQRPSQNKRVNTKTLKNSS